jgi:hypothetical protein
LTGSATRFREGPLPVSWVADVQVFHSWKCSSSAALLFRLPVLFRLAWPTAFPSPLWLPFAGRVAFTALPVLFGRPTTRRASLLTSLPIIESLAAYAPAPHIYRQAAARCKFALGGLSWTGPTDRVGTGGTDPLTEFILTMRSVRCGRGQRQSRASALRSSLRAP